MKYLIWLFMFLLIFSLQACQAPEEETVIPDQEETQWLELTLEELAYYNGKDGKPAYIAVDGYIYDVTNSSFWRNGLHNGYEAGQDLTEAIIQSSPHGIDNISRVPKVGILVSGA